MSQYIGVFPDNDNIQGELFSTSRKLLTRMGSKINKAKQGGRNEIVFSVSRWRGPCCVFLPFWVVEFKSDDGDETDGASTNDNDDCAWKTVSAVSVWTRPRGS